MRLLKKAGLRLRSIFRRHHVDGELDAELRGHLERAIEAHIAAGLPPERARAAALHEFGSITLVEDSRACSTA